MGKNNIPTRINIDNLVKELSAKALLEDQLLIYKAHQEKFKEDLKTVGGGNINTKQDPEYYKLLNEMNTQMIAIARECRQWERGELSKVKKMSLEEKIQACMEFLGEQNDAVISQVISYLMLRKRKGED